MSLLLQAWDECVSKAWEKREPDTIVSTILSNIKEAAHDRVKLESDAMIEFAVKVAEQLGCVIARISKLMDTGMVCNTMSIVFYMCIIFKT